MNRVRSQLQLYLRAVSPRYRGSWTARAQYLHRPVCREERVENLLLDVGWDACTIVANADFYPVACYCLQPRFKAIAGRLCALGCGVKSVRDQVQKHPSNFLRVNIRNSDRRIQIAFQRDVETLFLSAGSMLGEVEALVRTENLIRVDDVTESLKLVE
jgi:hypothetical protein